MIKSYTEMFDKLDWEEIESIRLSNVEELKENYSFLGSYLLSRFLEEWSSVIIILGVASIVLDVVVKRNEL